MKKQLATLLLVGFSGVVFAQGAQQPPSQGGAQPRQAPSQQRASRANSPVLLSNRGNSRARRLAPCLHSIRQIRTKTDS